ncbi:hypothetical protein [Escherichia coli]|nr:hypothetical protein [Escherichia coli]
MTWVGSPSGAFLLGVYSMDTHILR